MLLEASRDTAHPLTETTITKCLLGAYALGKEDGDSAPTRCLACGGLVRPRIQAKMYCSGQCKARLNMRRTRVRRAATSPRVVEETP